MSINDLNNSVGSWSQFVRLKEAARERNSGLGNVKGAAGVTGEVKAEEMSFSGILSAKYGANVYSSVSASAKAASDEAAARAAKGAAPTVGKLFDSFA